MYSQVQAYLKALNFESISDSRQAVLEPLIAYALPRKDLKLNFICTHNSRRSQFAQVWAQIAAYHHGVSLESYSGGVEITACNPRTIAALERSGLHISRESMGSNPQYLLGFAEATAPVLAFSKLYDDAVNPKGGFAAVMTCSHADENCPFIPGTEARIALNYEDPKAFDDTIHEERAYDERCFQIATEMMYVFKAIADGR